MIIYIHFPFCRRKCSYCSFFSRPFVREEVEAYVQTLLAEIAHWGSCLKHKTIFSLYLGGGTPSLLDTDFLYKIKKALDKSFTFTDDCEITLEANPESLTPLSYVQELLDLGVNRLSIGVQSLDDSQLRLLGRVHDASQAREAYFRAVQAGFSNINLDFLWSLPGQTPGDWIRQLKEISALNAPHLSCYALKVEKNTVLEQQTAANELQLPSEDEQADMFHWGSEFLLANGYEHYEISNFAFSGYACEHNLSYWNCRDYIGLGPGAVSTYAGKRWMNSKDLLEHSENIRQGDLMPRAESLSPAERTAEYIMLSLRLKRGMDLNTYKRLSGDDFLSRNAHFIEQLKKDDLAGVEGGHFYLTQRGMAVMNEILHNLCLVG